MTLYVINTSFSSGKVWLALNLNQGCCGVTAPRVLSCLGQLHLHFAGLPETGWDSHHHMYLRSWDRWSRFYKTWVVKTVTCVVCIQTGKSTLCVSEHKERRREFLFSVCRTLMLSRLFYFRQASHWWESLHRSLAFICNLLAVQSHRNGCVMFAVRVWEVKSSVLAGSCGFTRAPLLTWSTQGLVSSLQSPGLGWEQLCHKRSIASFLLDVCLVTVISLGVVKKIQRHFARMHATISYFRKRHLDTFGIFVSDKALPKKYKTKQKPSK